MRDRAITRRQALAAGLGAAAGLASGGALAAAGVTPPQTEGPFYPKYRQSDEDVDLTRVEGRDGRAEGQVIYVSGQVPGAGGVPVAGALVEVWQANSHGRYAHEDDPNPAPLDPNFQGYARVMTDEQGRLGFKTVKPGAYRVAADWERPPHIHYQVARRGYHDLTTQMYFPGEPLNDRDSIFLDVPAQDRVRVVAEPRSAAATDEAGTTRWGFDIRLAAAGSARA